MCKDNDRQQIIEAMKDYINSYDKRGSISVDVFIDDMLYGVGVSINPSKYRFAGGWRLFKRELLDKLTEKE